MRGSVLQYVRCFGRVNMRLYIALLALVYFSMLFVFYGNLTFELGPGPCRSGKPCRLHTTNVLGQQVTHHQRLKFLEIDLSRQADSQRKVLQTHVIHKTVNSNNMSFSTYETGENSEGFSENKADQFPVRLNESCFLSSLYPHTKFLPLEPSSFVYSAYFDDRYEEKLVHIMALLSLSKNNRRLKVFCHFTAGKSFLTEEATFYELCENHGKMFGGFILSCRVPGGATDVCSVNVTMEITPVHRLYKTPQTQWHVVAVSRLSPSPPAASMSEPRLNPTPSPSSPTVKHHRDQYTATQVLDQTLPVNDRSGNSVDTSNNNVSIDLENRNQSFKGIIDHIQIENSVFPFNYSVCIPPLFGTIQPLKLIEFIELNLLLGFQHFIFYTGALSDKNINQVLQYYSEKNIVTFIDFVLPEIVTKPKIWYNGQLSAHNDCLYRAMSVSRFVAIMDIDEYIVPHNGDYRVTDSLRQQFDQSANICALSFESAFYDPKYSSSSRKPGSQLTPTLVSQVSTSRTLLFSKVRTKVFVEARRVYEVGIHHVSKPARDNWRVVNVNTSLAFLHHYRACVPNYGMKCAAHALDLTMTKYGAALTSAVDTAHTNIFSQHPEL